MKYGLIVCLTLCTALGAEASRLDIGGGRFALSGQMVSDMTVASGAVLEGDGALQGALTVRGTVSPGLAAVENCGTLSCSGLLSFEAGSVFACYAASNTLTDQIVANAAVSGTAEVQAAGPAIPVDQVIIQGQGGSVYSGFTLGGASSTNWALITDGNNLLLSQITGDTDDNNIPDYWEIEYFGGRTNCDAAADSDSDEMLNWQEFVAGTDPVDDESYFDSTVPPQTDPNELVITWNSVSGKQYTVWRSSDILNGSFSAVASNVVATPPNNTFTNTVSSLVTYYYRVQVQP
jgi:hypothetical protein